MGHAMDLVFLRSQENSVDLFSFVTAGLRIYFFPSFLLGLHFYLMGWHVVHTSELALLGSGLGVWCPLVEAIIHPAVGLQLLQGAPASLPSSSVLSSGGVWEDKKCK